MECLHADHQEAQQAEQRCTGWERGVPTCLPIKVWTVQGDGGNRARLALCYILASQAPGACCLWTPSTPVPAGLPRGFCPYNMEGLGPVRGWTQGGIKAGRRL